MMDMNERSFENFLESFRLGPTMPAGAPAICVSHPMIGHIGTVTRERGFQLHRGMGSRAFHALLRDEEHYRANPTHSRWRRMVRKAKQAVYGELGAVSGWSDVISGRLAGQRDDFFGYKASATTVANQWSHFALIAGLPGATTYTNLTGAVMGHDRAGAWPLKRPCPATAKKFLLNVCTNHATGTNWVCVSDLLYAGGNISLTSTATQTGDLAVTRHTDGRGVCAILEVTATAGSTASNCTMIYDDANGGTDQSTGAQAMTASCRVNRTNPATGTSGGLAIPLVAGGKGVKQFVSVSFSASMGGSGVAAMLQHKPLIIMPTLNITMFVERAVPSMIMGMQELIYDSAADQLPFITFFVNTSSTSTGVQSYYINTGSA